MIKMADRGGVDNGFRVRQSVCRSNIALTIIVLIQLNCGIHVQSYESHQRHRNFEGERGERLRHTRQYGQPPPPRFSYLSRISNQATQTTSTVGSISGAKNSDACPCVLKPGTKECMIFDPRFMASTVEEAILHFPDLQMRQATGGANSGNLHGPDESTNQEILANSVEPMPPPPESLFMTPSPLPPLPLSGPNIMISDNQANSTKTDGSYKSRVGFGSGSPPDLAQSLPSSINLCENDIECQECSAALLNRLSTTGLLQGDELDRVSKKFGLEESALKLKVQTKCAKYHFEKSIANATMEMQYGSTKSKQNGTTDDEELDSLVEQLKEKGERKWKERQERHEREEKEGSEERKNGRGMREKRQVSTNATLSTIGQRYNIACTKRGAPVEEGSLWIGLCNVCWAWRKLPTAYFPQYINELVCDTDTKCMSGFGSCQQRYKSVDIMQNTGTDASPIWKQVTLSVANYCDCEVESGSSLHNFVAA